MSERGRELELIKRHPKVKWIRTLILFIIFLQGIKCSNPCVAIEVYAIVLHYNVFS